MYAQVKPKIFSSLNLMSCFQQLKMGETKHKGSFIVQGKQYQWNRMPFGLRNTPITFQWTMAHVLKGLLFMTVILYVHDILVMSDCIKCYKQHLQEVFDRLTEASLKLKASKCEFVVEEIQYLGHLLTPSSVRANPQKIQIIEDYETLTPLIHSTVTLISMVIDILWCILGQVTKVQLSCYKAAAPPLLDPHIDKSFSELPVKYLNIYLIVETVLNLWKGQLASAQSEGQKTPVPSQLGSSWHDSCHVPTQIFKCIFL